ncbi:restriction endonuclease subunit S [Cyclobacterium sp.]|uniref:restriction endonuclease subunit S n=1 Tax=Cyclobacterium sp. TaxID=1966343 RepID=UPI001998D383|nr:restriction endonuclease subunit S [Cyclobacterium sp.]MBD3629358.1 restriction endonuclease subunit S [Cyclobacterium sp.]
MMHLLEHFKELTVHPKNAEKLKGLILQLAVQGKLTQKWRSLRQAQGPPLEPASLLLEKIRAEKEEMIKAGKIKKEKPLPSIEEAEIPGSLPNGWKWCKLGNSGYTQTGSTPPKNDFTNYGNFIPFLGPGDISNQWMKYPKGGLSEKGIKIGRLIPKGSLMMVCIGGSIGKCNINDMDVSCNQQINTVSPLIIPPDYIKTVCQAPFFQKEVWVKSSGSATPIINKGKWENIIIPIPPLEEQKAIVATVNQLFAEVEQLEALTKERIKLKTDFVTSALNQLTKAAEQDVASHWSFIQQQFGTFFTEKSTIKKLRETILQLAVQGKLTHHWRTLRQAEGKPIKSASDLLEKIKAEKGELIKAGKIKKEKPLPEISEEEIPYDLPEGWVWCRFGELIIDIEAGKSPKCLPETANFDEWGVIKMSAISWGAFNGKENKALPKDETPFEDKEIKPGDFILTRANTSDLIAKSVIVPDSVRAKLLLNDKTLRIRFSNLISPEFLNLYNNGGQAREHYKKVSSGTSDSMQNISRENIKLLILPLPRLEEQKAIVEKVNALMTLCDKLEQEIDIHQNTQKQWMQGCLREVVKAKAPDELPLNMAAEPIPRYGNK